MKKFLLIITLLFISPMVFATCPIDMQNTVCTVPDFRENLSPIYNPKANINEFSNTPEARLNPANRDDIQRSYREFAPIKNELNYNTDCQFGVCLQDKSLPIFKQ